MRKGKPSTEVRSTRWLAAAGLAIAVTVALAAPASAQTGAATEASVPAGVELGETDEYRLALLRMRAHLGVAGTLMRLEAPGAEHHMAEAMQRLYAGAEKALRERSAPLTEEILRELEAAAAADPARALPAIESAVNAVNGSFAQTGGLEKGSVLDLVEALLREAVATYAEAVSGNEVVELRKYQTGRGLVTQAEALVRHATPLQDVAGQEELLKIVTLIRQAWPGISPPPIVFDPESVAGRLDEAVAVIDEMR